MSIFYDFVDFLKPSSFNENGELRGKVSLRLKTLTPLFIGSGSEDRAGEILYKSFQRYCNRLVIPGSTLKGVLRTISQAVSYSCVEVSPAIRKDLPFPSEACNCIVCRTYGKMGLKGRISFGDLLLVSGQTEIIKIPLQMNPNIEKREVYYQDGKLRGIKFYRHGDYRLLPGAEIPVEAAQPDSIFEGELIFQEISAAQLELLCYSLSLDGSFQLKIGGNKSGFFGSCIVEVKEAILDGKDFDPHTYACNYRNRDEKIAANQQKLTEILSYQNRVTELLE